MTETDAAAEAWAELNSALADIEQNWVGQPGGEISGEERAARRYLVANSLQHAFDAWFEADPVRPMFYRWLSPTKKLLGDNPDSLYYFAPIRDDRSYRITGNVGAATFTSFTIEKGSDAGHAAKPGRPGCGRGRRDARRSDPARPRRETRRRRRRPNR